MNSKITVCEHFMSILGQESGLFDPPGVVNKEGKCGLLFYVSGK